MVKDSAVITIHQVVDVQHCHSATEQCQTDTVIVRSVLKTRSHWQIVNKIMDLVISKPSYGRQPEICPTVLTKRLVMWQPAGWLHTRIYGFRSQAIKHTFARAIAVHTWRYGWVVYDAIKSGLTADPALAMPTVKCNRDVNRARQLYKNISMLFLFPVKDGKLSAGVIAIFNASCCYG